MQKVTQIGQNIKACAMVAALEPEWVPMAEIARRFSISPRSIYRYLSLETFPRPRSVRGRKNLFNLNAVRAFFGQLPERGTH